MPTEASALPTPALPRLPRGSRTEEISRVPVRQRLGTVTLSAWRLVVGSEEGAGTIVFIENGEKDRFFRGDGVFLGWSQDDLESAWDELKRTPDEPEASTQQLG